MGKKFLPHLSVLAIVILLSGLFLTINASRENQDKRSRATETTPTGSYQMIGKATGFPVVNKQMVGPAGATGRQKFYISYGSLETAIVSIDPANNYQATSHTSPVASQTSPWGMTVGSDNNIYLGGASSGPGGAQIPSVHLLKFDTTTQQFLDAGAVPVDPSNSVNQTIMWDVTSSPFDRKIYGCTSPSANLIRYDPATGQMTTLGRMDPSNYSIRSCVADQHYIYMGLGSTSQKIMVYDLQSNTATTLATSTQSGFANIYLGSDSKVYGIITQPNGSTQKYLLSNGQATTVTSAPAALATNVFTSGDKISISTDDTTVTITHPNGTKNNYPYTYEGGPVRIWQISEGPDRNIYFGTTFPIYLERFSPDNPSAGFTNLGKFGDGEIYSIIKYNNKLAMMAYGANFPLATYDPSLPISRNANGIPSCSGSPLPQNPACTTTIANWGSGLTTDFRNHSLVPAPDGNLYGGTKGHYGELSGALVKWNTQTSNATAYHIYPDLGITSLTVAYNCNGITGVNYCLVGGTTSLGGSGTTPTAANAPLFIWNTATNSLAQTIPIPNVPNAKITISLIRHPLNNYVYGIVETTDSKQFLFIFNPYTGTFINGGTQITGFTVNRDYNYDALAIGSDNNIWGMGSTGAFKIDIATGTVQFVSTAPEPVTTAGFAFVKDPLHGDKMYFAAANRLYVYNVPLIPPDIVWANPTNVSINGNTIIKASAGTAWDSGATSTQAIPSGNGFTELTITNNDYVTMDKRWMFGLNHDNTTASYTDIDYAFYFKQEKVQIWENGGRKPGSPETTFALDDTFKIAVENGRVTYYKNDTALFTSNQTPVYPLFADTSILMSGVQVAGKLMGATTALFPAPSSPTPTSTPTPTPHPTNTPTPTPTPVNLALNRPVTAGSIYSSTYAGSKAVDGSTSTYWISKNTARWLTVDLGALKNVSKFVIKHSTGTYTTKYFTIQTSSDNTNWTTVVNVNNNTASTTTHTIPTRSARYMKLNIVTPAQNTYPYAIIPEFEIY